ncbi:MAG: ABC transporter permease [Lactobacillus sp.]
MTFLKLARFQFKLYVKDTYFVNLVIIETTTMLLYQYLAHYIGHTYTGQEWLIAGVIGTWASCTTSAGALGYQQWQGTLPYLLNTVISHEKVLLATLMPAALYGLVSFPLAGIEAKILGMPIKLLDWQLILGILLLWLAATTLSYFISLFFLLSRNAMAYEQLLLLPILLLSGLIGIPTFIANAIRPFQMLSPLTLPIKLIYHVAIHLGWIVTFMAVMIGLLVLCKLLTDSIIKHAFKEGRLNIF